MHGLEAEYWGEIDFVYLDREAAANAEVVQAYGATSQPIFVLVAPDGTEIQRWFGAPSPDELRAAFDSYLAGG